MKTEKTRGQNIRKVHKIDNVLETHNVTIVEWANYGNGYENSYINLPM